MSDFENLVSVALGALVTLSIFQALGVIVLAVAVDDIRAKVRAIK